MLSLTGDVNFRRRDFWFFVLVEILLVNNMDADWDADVETEERGECSTCFVRGSNLSGMSGVGVGRWFLIELWWTISICQLSR